MANVVISTIGIIGRVIVLEVDVGELSKPVGFAISFAETWKVSVFVI